MFCLQYLSVLLHVLVILEIPENFVEGQVTVKCNDYEYITEDILGNQSCVACPKCEAGYGLIPECGNFIKYGGKFGCHPCIHGISYSPTKRIGSCKPCGICTDPQTVINKCNRTQNSKCGKNCVKGFYYSPETSDCQECSWCCGGSNDRPVKDCQVSEVPLYKQCSLEDNLRCQPRCTENQFVFVDIKTLKRTCTNCRSCGIGKGLSPKCSSVITSKSYEPMCTTCVAGITFSDVQDESSCKPCTKCDFGEKIESACNISHNTLCGDCMHGFYRDEVDPKNVCKPCSFCCGDKQDVHVPECKAKGMPTNKQCAYTERAVVKCMSQVEKKSNHFVNSEGFIIGMGVGISVFICVVGSALFFLRKSRRRGYNQIVEQQLSHSLDHSPQSSCQLQETPSKDSTPFLIKFIQCGVKVKCQDSEVGQEILKNMHAEVSWHNNDFPKLKEREVFLSPVIKLHLERCQTHQTFRLNLPHSAHFDDEHKEWSFTVLKSNKVSVGSFPPEWTNVGTLKDIEVEKGGVELIEKELGTYVVVGTPGIDQTLSKKRMLCAVFGKKNPTVGRPYSTNMHLCDDCEPSFLKIREEEQSKGHVLMASLCILYPDVHPNSVINISIENVSDGWLVDYSPKKFKSKHWVDSYTSNPKVEALFEHRDITKQDFRCLFKVGVNDTNTIEIPVNSYFKASEPIYTSVQGV